MNKPILRPYNGVGKFRFWVQMVLPTIYDDSLSYMELLSKVVKMLNDIADDVEAVEDNISILEEFMLSYFENLDVQEEIDAKLDQMAEDGTLARIIAPAIASSAAPVMVDSISKMVDTSKIYVLTTNGYIYIYKNDAWVNTGLQYGADTTKFYQSLGVLPVGSDLDDLKDTGTYYLESDDYLNLPNTVDHKGRGMIETVKISSILSIQTYTNIERPKSARWVRYSDSQGWRGWTTQDYVMSDSYLPSGTNIDDIFSLITPGKSIGFTTTNYSYTNLPPVGDNANVIIETVRFSSSIGWQRATNFANGREMYRHHTSSGWSDWIEVYQFKRYQTSAKMIAFGDSIMYGAKWIDDGQGGAIIERTPMACRIPTKIGNACGITNIINAAVGGAGYVATSAQNPKTILDIIKDYDIRDMDLIVIGGGRNDYAIPLGTAAGSAAGDGTIIGAIKEIVEYIKENNHKANVIFIPCTPSTNSNSDVWTKTSTAGWSISDFYEQAAAAMAQIYTGSSTESFKCIDLRPCRILNYWADYTGAGGNYAHPNNDETYKQIAAFIAGRCAYIYRN